MQEKETEITETVFEDWSVIAFLSLSEIQKKYRLEVIPFTKTDGRVAFRVRGHIEQAIAQIYANQKVGINDFMRSVKQVRNTIFTLRSLSQGKKGK